MPVRQPTIGESFKRILQKKKESLGKREVELAAKKSSMLDEWSKKHKRLEADYAGKTEALASVRQMARESERIKPLIDKYIAPIAEQAAKEGWNDSVVRAKVIEATRKMGIEAASPQEIIASIRVAAMSKKPAEAWKRIAPGRMKGMAGRMRGKGPLAVVDLLRAEEEALQEELGELEKKKADMKSEYARKLQEYEEEMRKTKEGVESASVGMESLGVLGFAPEKPRVRETREMRLAAFALRHAGARPMVESQIRRLRTELGGISPLAAELDAYRKSVKKLEEKQLEPLFKLLQRHGVLRKEEKQYVSKEFLKDALRKLRDKVPGAELERQYALMSTVSKYAQYQRNIGRLERMMEESGAYGKMQKIQAQLERLENIKRLMLQAKR